MNEALKVKLINKGQSYGKSFNAFDIAAVDSDNEVLAYYIGYYSSSSKLYKLFPEHLTTQGKKSGYKMQKQVIKEEELM